MLIGDTSKIELEFVCVGFWGEGKTGAPGEKPLGARTRTNNKLKKQRLIHGYFWTSFFKFFERFNKIIVNTQSRSIKQLLQCKSTIKYVLLIDLPLKWKKYFRI